MTFYLFLPRKTFQTRAQSVTCVVFLSRRGCMKKIVLLCCLAGSAQAHDFLTEMLVFNSEYGYNPYHVAVSYHLTESDLDQTLNISRTKYELKQLTKRSNAREKRTEYKQIGRTDCDFESDNLEKTCGVFDHFNAARVMAVDTCNAYAVAHSAHYPAGLIPQFTGPGTFTNGSTAAVDHHENYRFAHGLSFNCVEVISKKEPYQIKK